MPHLLAEESVGMSCIDACMQIVMHACKLIFKLCFAALAVVCNCLGLPVYLCGVIALTNHAFVHPFGVG